MTEFQNARLHEAAKNLAHFRLDFVSESDPVRKSLLDKEFKLKFAEYLEIGRDPEKARLEFQAAYETAQDQERQKTIAEKTRLLEKVRLEEQESATLQRWTHELKLQPFGKNGIHSFEITPDGSKILFKESWPNPGRKIYDVKSMKEIYSAAESRTEQIHSVSADSSTLFLYYGGNDYRLIDLRAMTEVPVPNLRIPKGKSIFSPKLSSDGTKLLYAVGIGGVKPREIKYYDLKNKKSLPVPIRQVEKLDHLFLTNDDSKLIVTTFDTSEPTPQIFDLKTQAQIQIPGLPKSISTRYFVNFNRETNLLAIYWHASKKQLFLDLTTLQSYSFEFSQYLTPKFLPHTNWVLEGEDGQSFLIDPRSEKFSLSFHDPKKPNASSIAAITPDGSYIMVSYGDGPKIIDNNFSDLFWSAPDVATVSDVIASADGNRFYARINGSEFTVFFKNQTDFDEVQSKESTP